MGSLINGIGVGVIYHSFTVFFLPLKRDLGVSSAAISLLYGAARLEGGNRRDLVWLFDRPIRVSKGDYDRGESGQNWADPAFYRAQLPLLFLDLPFHYFGRFKCGLFPSRVHGGQ